MKTRTEGNKIDELLKLPDTIGLHDLDHYMTTFFEKRVDKDKALLELDDMIGKLQNRVQLLSIYVKQHYLSKHTIDGIANDESSFYTKQEIAVRFRVSMRTITNWMIAGLKTTVIGGVIRISQQALDEFVKNNKRRKYNWRSIARPRS